jgi:outer membrane protein assembly factor BamB
MNDIRHMATSYAGPTMALAEFEKRVQILDLNNWQVIAAFDTILDFGGRRLAISEDGGILICGCWERYGICAYETRTGKLIWQRKDLKKVQHIQALHADKGKFFAQFAIGASRTFDIYTGADNDKITGADFYFESRFDAIDVVDKSSKIQIADRQTRKATINIPRQSFATMDIAIADNSFAVGESAGPLCCYDIRSGRMKWKIASGKEHYMRLCFNQQLDKYLGVSWSYGKGGDKTLRYIDKENGTVEQEVNIGSPGETEFALSGQWLVSSDRVAFNIETGDKKSWA